MSKEQKYQRQQARKYGDMCKGNLRNAIDYAGEAEAFRALSRREFIGDEARREAFDFARERQAVSDKFAHLAYFYAARAAHCARKSLDV